MDMFSVSVTQNSQVPPIQNSNKFVPKIENLPADWPNLRLPTDSRTARITYASKQSKCKFTNAD